MSAVLRVGTRGSPLARWQAGWLRTELERTAPDLGVELVVIRTESDRQPDLPITELGTRGVFTRDLEVALLEGRIDVAVHSLKDLPSEEPPGLLLAATSPREDPRDALLTLDGRSLADLPPGSRLGTSSLRRTALARATRPNVRVEPLRGNIDTRLRKLHAGDYDAIVMALAALRRLGRVVPYTPLDPAEWVPAVAQGIIGLQARTDDVVTLELLRQVNDAESFACASAERGVLRSLGGGCSVPVGALATLENGSLTLRALVAAADGSRILRAARTLPVERSRELVAHVVEDLQSQGAGQVLAGLRAEVPLLSAPSDTASRPGGDRSYLDSTGPAAPDRQPQGPRPPRLARPLEGRRILVTRAAAQARELCELIAEQGG
ncbi:MAG: hydroxymethylbilane synthase, partial [Chloroflexota bacterium]|nr:hydroxymethylbilane synthase [Chloroflexota bacterium]